MSKPSLMRPAEAIVAYQDGGYTIKEIRLNPNWFAENITELCGIPIRYGTAPQAKWEIQLGDIILDTGGRKGKQL